MKDLHLDAADLTWLAHLARALIREPHAADDLVQETAIAALTAPLPDDAPRRAWLASVARRLAARRFRSEARRARREELVARPEALPDSAELVERAEIAEQVTAAVRRLPEPFRRTLLLRFLEGLGPEEIARREGKPADTVRWRVRRGLEQLRGELVTEHDRDWSSWCVLLVPLARANGDAGVATAGASGGSFGLVVSVTVMKAIVALMVVGSAGLWWAWEPEETELGRAGVVDEGLEDGVARAATDSEPEDGLAGEPLASEREVALASTTDGAADLGADQWGLFGRVVDEAGAPVPGATVYLIPGGEVGEGTKRGDDVRARTESDPSGGFRLPARDWMADAARDEQPFDLGVSANGFLRTVLSDIGLGDVALSASADGLTVTLERGRSLIGRVVDAFGQPVPGLELLAHTAFADVAHVSPTRRMVLAERNELAGASSGYEQARATTDWRGEVEFTGLPDGDLRVLSLDAGWTIEDPVAVEAGGPFVVWTAGRRLGVRLVVSDVLTRQLVALARATFCVEVTFADGETEVYEQWVGSGVGEVSFVLDPELVPGLAERTITRARFFGTARAKGGASVNWTAEPIEDSEGATGVVEVAVAVDATPIPSDADLREGERDEEPEQARLALDVRYEDGAPFDGELVVRWTAPQRPGARGKARLEAEGAGRYTCEVWAGDLTLEVYDRFASGSVQRWTGSVSCTPGEDSQVFVTLPRGGAATINRPIGWEGVWRVHASWRASADEEWFGSMNYGTDEESLTLNVLQPGQWRLRLTRDGADGAEPLERIVEVEEGESVVVDG